MLRNREPALRIQYMLARQMRQIWRAKELLAAGAARGEIASGVGISPYFLDDVLVPAKRMSRATLARAFERLYQPDVALKSSRLDAELPSRASCRRSRNHPRNRAYLPAPAGYGDRQARDRARGRPLLDDALRGRLVDRADRVLGAAPSLAVLLPDRGADLLDRRAHRRRLRHVARRARDALAVRLLG